MVVPAHDDAQVPDIVFRVLALVAAFGLVILAILGWRRSRAQSGLARREPNQQRK